MEFIILAIVIAVLYYWFNNQKKKKAQKRSIETSDFLRDRYGKPEESYHDVLEEEEVSSEIDDEGDIFHGEPDVPNYGTKRKPSAASLAKKKINPEDLNPHEGADENSFFFGKKVVFTGNMDYYDRDEAAYLVASMGGDVNTAISGKTDYVIVGVKPGKVKLEKIKSLNEKGKNIQILNEYQFQDIIEEHQKKASE